MKPLGSKPLAAALLSLGVAGFLVLAVQIRAAQQAPPAGAAGQPAAAPQGAAPGQGTAAPARGRGAGGGRGAAPLGDGPWDFGEGASRIHVTVVTKGLDHPWGMAFLPNGDMLVTERGGRLRIVRKGVLDPEPITGLPQIRAVSLGGLLDIALHPNFAQNRLIYFAYSKPGAEEPAKSALAVGRARFDGGTALTDVKDIFVAEPYFGGRGAPQRCCGQGPTDASFGSRLAFDRSGFLYVTSGDRNYGEQSQETSSDIGKILRLKDDGAIPPDNPFVGKAGYRPEIYTIGHRNPLGLTINPVTGDLWSTEFGPRGGDELNRIQAGKNYGWILITNGMHYNGEPVARGANGVPGFEDPVQFWVPSINPGNIAFYNGDKFPAWKGNLFMAAMTQVLVRMTLDANMKVTSQDRMLTDLRQRLRDVRVGPDGYLYVLTDETAGAMLKIEPGK